MRQGLRLGCFLEQQEEHPRPPKRHVEIERRTATRDVKLSQLIESCGFISAPFFYEYTNWVAKNAFEHNFYAHGFMRGAGPIARASTRRYVNKLYINREIISATENDEAFAETVNKYLRSKNKMRTCDDIVLLDDDVCYGVTTNFIASKVNSVQVLPIAVWPDSPLRKKKNVRGFMNQHRWINRDGENDMSYLFWVLTQDPPREYAELDKDIFKVQPDGKVIVEPKPSQNAWHGVYYKGFDTGIKECCHSSSDERFAKYRKLLINTAPYLENALELTNEGYNEESTAERFEKISGTLDEKLTEAHYAVERLYS